MKYILDIQFFGGRGSSSVILPKRSQRKQRKSSPGTMLVNQTLKEAIGKKGSSNTMGEALNSVNRDRYNLSYAAYTENCQRCVVAYELQRRGYDVSALPTHDSDNWPRVVRVGDELYGRWRGAFKHAKNIDVSARTTALVTSNIDKQMSSFGSGSRGVVQVFWKNGGGHVFNVENVNGKIVYADAQTGRRLKNGNEYMKDTIPSTVRLIRTDNLQISDRAKQFVTKKSKYNQ